MFHAERDISKFVTRSHSFDSFLSSRGASSDESFIESSNCDKRETFTENFENFREAKRRRVSREEDEDNLINAAFHRESIRHKSLQLMLIARSCVGVCSKHFWPLISWWKRNKTWKELLWKAARLLQVKSSGNLFLIWSLESCLATKNRFKRRPLSSF